MSIDNDDKSTIYPNEGKKDDESLTRSMDEEIKRFREDEKANIDAGHAIMWEEYKRNLYVEDIKLRKQKRERLGPLTLLL